jgi:hypothetical protein
MILNDHLKLIYSQSGGAYSQSRSGSVAKSILLIPTDYGVLCLLFIFIGDPLAFFTVYTLFFVANASHLLLASFKWFKDMGKMAPALVDTPLGEKS